MTRVSVSDWSERCLDAASCHTFTLEGAPAIRTYILIRKFVANGAPKVSVDFTAEHEKEICSYTLTCSEGTPRVTRGKCEKPLL
jgi:hypothetical protein